MKVMISQGMNGRTETDIKEERNIVKEKLNKLGIDVVDTLFSEEVSESFLNPSLYYLAKSIQILGNVNAVIFVGDWSKYRGCRIEHEIAKAYGVKILYEDFIDYESDKIVYRTNIEKWCGGKISISKNTVEEK